MTHKLLTLGFMLLASGVTMAQDLKVFDLKLGDSMTIRECSCKVVEDASLSGLAVKKDKFRGILGKKPNISKRYIYTENVAEKDKCFQRVGMYYTESPTPGTPAASNLPPVLPPNNEKVKLIYSLNKRPGIADAEDIWIGIQDHRLTGIRFYFNFHNADSVYQILVKKYGKASNRNDFFVTGPNGDKKDYYEVKWSLPKLKVTLLSIDTNQIGYDPNNAPLGYLSEVGSVTIQYLAPDVKKKEDNNKL